MTEEVTTDKSSSVRGKRVALLVTCLIDQFRPEAGFASVTLLEQAGCIVEVPQQGCCGQPNFNGGDLSGARSMALDTIARFSAYDYVVVPAGSCAAMVSVHFAELFEKDSAEYADACKLADKTFELTQFLVDIAGVQSISVENSSVVAIHDACSALRELGVRSQPRKLLALVKGLDLQELANPEVCCGFGGTFCVKYPDISNRMAEKKLADVETTASPVKALVSTDLGCLMHLGGKLHRDGSEVQVWHIAEVLAGSSLSTDGDATG